ncbi:MFS transporter [Microlunatus parietis]|uniref:MFS family permease n=1 Tax=Microlunatus parietis TaxID=682979 RepID=A0A7Y9IE66_9ACTN|nr:MFS transporter [Microlunatus parietis]NYE75097.1 MFS family permease [Microlunatus parietis]
MTTQLHGSRVTNDRKARKVLWASLVGTSLESFDFYVFSYLSAFFIGPLFFEPLGVFGGTLSAFLANALGFVARPLGAIVFGHLGDRFGRRAALIITITIMGVATGAIGLLPDYATAGWLGAVLLVGLRLVQGLSLGGEWGGAVLLSTESARPGRRALYAAVPQLGSPVGSIVSAALYLALPVLLSEADLLAWGWRVPFLAAFPLLLVSLWLRYSIDETPIFREVVAEDRRARLPLLQAFRQRPLAMLLATGAALLGIGSYSLMNTYTLNYGVTTLNFDYSQLLLATTIGGLLQLITIPLFGFWAERIGSARVVLIGAIGTLVVAFPIYALLQSASFGILVAMMIIGGILPTLSWAALGGLMTELFAGRFRYAAISFAYAVAAIISGFVPAVTLLLGQASDYAWWHPAVVLAAMSVITAVSAALAIRRTEPIDVL